MTLIDHIPAPADDAPPPRSPERTTGAWRGVASSSPFLAATLAVLAFALRSIKDELAAFKQWEIEQGRSPAT